VPELLNGTNHVPWFEAGATIFSKNGIQYLGIPGLINARSIIATLIVQVSNVGSCFMVLRQLQGQIACLLAHVKARFS